VDPQFRRITLHHALPTDFVRQLMESGFVILPGAVSAGRLAEISAAYDALMISGSGSDFKVGSTTTRLYLVNNRVSFEDVCHYPPLLEACAHLIGQPFMLSSLLGRTLRSAAQDIHTDIGRDCADAPMARFILMLDPFKQGNGAPFRSRLSELAGCSIRSNGRSSIGMGR
jgi:hypothetical protein